MPWILAICRLPLANWIIAICKLACGQLQASAILSLMYPDYVYVIATSVVTLLFSAVLIKLARGQIVQWSLVHES